MIQVSLDVNEWWEARIEKIIQEHFISIEQYFGKIDFDTDIKVIGITLCCDPDEEFDEEVEYFIEKIYFNVIIDYSVFTSLDLRGKKKMLANQILIACSKKLIAPFQEKFLSEMKSYFTQHGFIND